VRWQEAKRPRAILFLLFNSRDGRNEKGRGRRIPPESIVLIWKYIQQHIQILVARLDPIYLP
jgi:hypothetical protein